MDYLKKYDKLIGKFPNLKFIEDYKKQERYFINNHEMDQIL